MGNENHLCFCSLKVFTLIFNLSFFGIFIEEYWWKLRNLIQTSILHLAVQTKDNLCITLKIIKEVYVHFINSYYINFINKEKSS